MKVLLNALLIFFMALALIIPIGVGAWIGLSNSQQDNVGGSVNESIEIGLTLSETDIVLSVGQDKTLTAMVENTSDSYIYQWDSSDKSVATVVRSEESALSGVVTALESGTTTITVNVIDKSQFKIIESVSCNLKVVNSNIVFSVPQVVISLDNGNSSTVSAVAPDEGEITWSSEDESIATVENGVITAHKAGQVYIVAKSGQLSSKLLVKVYNSVISLLDVETVAVGSNAQITVNGILGEGAKWTVADSRIATIDENGIITGVKTGMTTVKVESGVDDQVATCVIVVKGGSADPTEMLSGKKAAAAADPGNWYYLCESNNVSTAEIPVIDNGVMHFIITNIGTSGANFFYLRYQPDDVGDVIYKHTLYIYSEYADALIEINGKANYLKAGLNRIEMEYTSAAPKNGNPYQIKFKEKGEFYVIPVFEEVSRVEKMILSNEFVTLNTTTNNSVTLTATVPGQTSPVIEWVSSNPAVATIENGVVTAVGEGSTMITAICGNMSATCLITVEGETGIEGTELKSGNKSATLGDPGNWYYLADGKTNLNYKPVIDSEGNIHMSIASVDTANKKYAYLRYQPSEAGTYKVTVTIEFAGADGSTVDVTGGNVTTAESKQLTNGTNTFEFTFTKDNSTPFQLKLTSAGNYVVNVTFTEQ